MDDPDLEALFLAGDSAGISRKVFVTTGEGIRIYTRLPNGEIDRTIEETNLVPSLPYKTSKIYILPNPTAEYATRPYDEEVPPEYFGTALIAIDHTHGIQSVEAFASLPNGTNPLTAQLLPPGLIKMDQDDFTLWCTLTFSDGNTPKTIKCSP